MELPNFAQDLVLEFIAPIERLGISQRIDKNEQQKIDKARAVIYKNVRAWKLEYKEMMNVNFYSIPKVIFKKFYPMCLRKIFIECALDYLAEDISRFIDKFEFNDVIDALTEEELNFLGWVS